MAVAPEDPDTVVTALEECDTLAALVGTVTESEGVFVVGNL